MGCFEYHSTFLSSRGLFAGQYLTETLVIAHSIEHSHTVVTDSLSTCKLYKYKIKRGC